MNDSTIERAILPDQGFTAEHIEGDHYNQLSGKEMVARFVDGELRFLDISGNVEIISYPEESDSTINKIVNAESSFLSATFRGRTTEKSSCGRRPRALSHLCSWQRKAYSSCLSSNGLPTCGLHRLSTSSLFPRPWRSL